MAMLPTLIPLPNSICRNTTYTLQEMYVSNEIFIDERWYRNADGSS
jgi:hypothetical protein